MGDRLTARKTDFDPRQRKGWAERGWVRPGLCARSELGLVGEGFSEEEAMGAGLLPHLVPVKERIGDLGESLPLLQKELWGLPGGPSALPWSAAPSQMRPSRPA